MNKQFTHNGTDSGEHRKGAISLEASLVFPVFFFCIMLFSRLFLLIMTECFVAKAVCSLPQDMAVVSYGERYWLKEKVTAPSLLCYPELFAKLSKNSQIKALRIICRDDSGQNVEVCVKYNFPVQAPGLPVFNLAIQQKFLIHTFIGEYDADKLSEPDKEEEKEVVYITESGKVYHVRKSCPYIFVATESVGLEELSKKRNSSGAKYYPCDKCKGSRYVGAVYITSYGNKYHMSAQCSSLVRKIKEVSLEEAGDKRPCSKCAQ